MSGRGKLLESLMRERTHKSVESNASQDNSVKDSGLGSRSKVSNSENKNTGPGSLTNTTSSEKTSVGHGRAQMLSMLKNVNNLSESNNSPAEISFSRGRGRAKVFEEISSIISTMESQSVPAPEEHSKNTCLEPEYEKTFEVATEEQTQSINKHGTKGMSVKLACNYIRLSSDPAKGVYEYEVRFKPNVDSVSLRMQYLNQHHDKIGGTKTFDGVTLYLPILLPEKLTTYISQTTIGTEIEVRIHFKRRKALQDCIHLYNVLFDRVMKTLNYVRFDRKQYDPTAPKIIPQYKLELWPGYVTAVDEYEGGLMLCCDVSHRLLCQKTVLDTLREVYQSNPNSFQDNARKALLGSVVLTRYNNRTYRIDDICFDKTPMSTFKARDTEISYINYYKTNHDIEIIDKKQPLLISIRKQRIANRDVPEEFVFCLIPEICFLTGLRDDMRSDFKLMREIATFTRVTPNQRLEALEKFHKNVHGCKEARDILNNWGLTLGNRAETVLGRQFEEEQINFANKKFSAGINADFGKYATNNELLEVIHLNDWLVIHYKNDNKAARSFTDLMERNSRAMGIQVQRPRVVVLNNDRIETYVNALRQNISRETQIVICLCPTSRDDRYSAIKKVCCAEIPIPSQVINARTLANDSKNRSIVQKIALQMNCKLGGTLWSVNIPFKNVMICGIDSYHDAAQQGNSVSAFVASLNSSYTKWFSKAVIQTRREEIVNGLCASLIAALLAFDKYNGKLPNNIIIFRDGVGDGQLSLCSSYEVPQFEAACQKGFLNYKAKITFIVVQKRINTRMFANIGANYSNPNPGTVLDNTVTRRAMYDFFLVSQSVRQGTVSPTHYIIIKDDADFSPDILQRLSYKLCFLYYNWPGTVRIPACCQYAHKMAYLIGQSIRRTTAEELANKLFYL